MNGTILETLKGKRRIFLDSPAVIYFIQERPQYFSVVRLLFEHVDTGRLEGFSSVLTLGETLVKPFQEQRFDLAEKYREILLYAPNFRLVPIDSSITEQGARIRASFPFKTPDAIQLATAVRHGAEAFVTNDKQLRQFNNHLPILLLDEFIQSPAH